MPEAKGRRCSQNKADRGGSGLATVSAFFQVHSPDAAPSAPGFLHSGCRHRLRSALAATPGRFPLLLRTGKLFLEGLHDKEARGQIPFLGVIVEVKLHDLH